ncbi:hypothetical protein BKA69DRAFT_1056763 [Paraphysoderma sedebokerense]|nr:hypothetical protein BKA69DRAFT_1056763 [Paraphysoderma sedebokerense]
MNRENSNKRSFNPEIHPRCRYFNNPPDFAFLASKYPSFAPFVYTSQQGTPTIDFKNPDAVRFVA